MGKTLKKLLRRIKVGDKSLEVIFENSRDGEASHVTKVAKRQSDRPNAFEQWWETERINQVQGID